MARRPVPVPVAPVVARQQPVERIHEVVVGSGADLDDDDAGRRVGHEDGQQPIPSPDVGDERRAGGGQVRQAARRAGPDRELPGVYGKMLRRASRMRPRPPIAGADS